MSKTFLRNGIFIKHINSYVMFNSVEPTRKQQKLLYLPTFKCMTVGTCHLLGFSKYSLK